MEKISCTKCSNLILQATSDRNGGVCSPCLRAEKAKGAFDFPTASRSMIDKVQQEVSAKIGIRLADIGFKSDDHLRYLRAKGDLIQYFLFVPTLGHYSNNRGLTDGMHIQGIYGECLTYAEDFRIISPARKDYLHPPSKMEIQNGRYQYFPWESAKHKAVAEKKYLQAIVDIDGIRFSDVSSDHEYVNAFLRSHLSETIVYYLTRYGLRQEADAWLYLYLHKYGGLSARFMNAEVKSASLNPEAHLNRMAIFAEMSDEERSNTVVKLIKSNIESSEIGWLYDA